MPRSPACRSLANMEWIKPKLPTRCISCGQESPLISRTLGVCLSCIRNRFAEVAGHIEAVHQKTRQEFNLPLSPPKNPEGIPCPICVNACSIGPGERGYCGIRENRQNKLKGGGPEGAHLSWYFDSLPTNCVADWVCPGGTGAGFPKFALKDGPEYGYKNLAVFYQACTFNCLFCQNWHFRQGTGSVATPVATNNGRPHRSVDATELAKAVDGRTSCICYFGGDPTAQARHSIAASRLALTQNKGRILRICWETNGSMSRALLRQMAQIALSSGGCIKFDLKAGSEELALALCGVTKERSWENFAYLAEMAKERPQPPLLIASTLLVPGYIDEAEVAKIASFIASLNPEIPYSLLAFYPHFYMSDLPTTSRNHAFRVKATAQEAGLKRVRIGNIHLLSNAY